MICLTFQTNWSLQFSRKIQPLNVWLTNGDLDRFHKWTITNKLSVNKSKAKWMMITSHGCKNSLPIKINDLPFQFELYAQFLGVFLDHGLKFDVDVKYECWKVSEALEILYRMKDLLPVKVIRALYHSVIRITLINTRFSKFYFDRIRFIYRIRLAHRSQCHCI